MEVLYMFQTGEELWKHYGENRFDNSRNWI